MGAPVLGQAHICKRNLRKFIKEGKKALLPVAGNTDFSQPELADGEHKPDAVGGKAWREMPLRVFVFARHGWFNADDPVPDPGMMGAGIAQGEDRLGPRKQLLIRKAKVGCGLFDNGRIEAVGELECGFAGHQFAGHPQGQVVVAISIGLGKVFDECVGGSLAFILQLCQPCVMFGQFKAFELEEAFQISRQFFQERARFEAEQIEWIKVAEGADLNTG